MFDNLRQQSTEPFDDAASPEAFMPASGADRFLGLTPAQQFVLALMIFLNVTVLGFFILLAFERIALPF